MVGGELVVKEAGRFDLREESAKAKLREVWSKGHVYVELREERKKDGKRYIFFCILCLSKCYNDTVLDDHLGGNPHSRRRAFADSTLFNNVPWPFSDGVLFCFNQPEKEKQLSHPTISYESAPVIEHRMALAKSNMSSDNRCLALVGKDKASDSVDFDAKIDNLGIVVCSNDNMMPLRSKSNVSVVTDGCGETMTDGTDDNYHVLHGVLVKEKMSPLGIRLMGFGHISGKYCQNDEDGDKAGRIWCSWLGKENSDDEDLSEIPIGDFAIINFAYTYDLGRRGRINDSNLLVSSDSQLDIEARSGQGNKRKRALSDIEDSTGCSSEQGDSSCEDGSGSNSSSVDKLTLNDEQSHFLRHLSTKAMRRELRKLKRLSAGKNCDICQQPMLPHKDVAALLNLKTGKLVCSSRNTNGAFHAYHISCLIHWILVCELELRSDKTVNAKKPRGRKGKALPKDYVSSILCPECQGTGINIKGNKLEKPTVALTKIFLCKMRAIEGHREWKKDPEILPQSSTGLHFSIEGQLQEKGLPNKLLPFYRAEIEL